MGVRSFLISKKPKKEDEIIVKKGRFGKDIKLDLGDYRAFVSFGLIGATGFLAYTGTEGWREFAIMTGMAISYWFRKGD